ncbi:YkvA family protein [Solibacillus sp. FSL K6-1523]|uniref:YkvA family protein n=1 Tax=Solibacillus sp. FSL K6-1523 TaxID=2921471 RepID=UPI0030F7B5AA
MSENFKFDKMIEGQDKHYSDKKFLSKMKGFGGGLGYKAMQAASTLFVALKSPDMSKANKLIMLGALGYFILPLDVVADFLPLVGLTDDAFIIVAALAKVYTSITDEMKIEADEWIEKTLGSKTIPKE